MKTSPSTIILSIILRCFMLVTVLSHPDHGLEDSDDDDLIIFSNLRFENDLLKQREKALNRAARKQDSKQLRQRKNDDPYCIGCNTIEIHYYLLVDQAKQTGTSRITDEMLETEITVLNDDFRDTPFQFVNKKTNIITNDRWATSLIQIGGSEIVSEIVTELRVGGSKVINIFVADGICQSTDGVNYVGGFAPTPFSFYHLYSLFPVDVYHNFDYVFLCPISILRNKPRSSHTATHEIGHWLGLFHTFQGSSCDPSNPNDWVDDTPQQARAVGCALDANSCPNLPGLDPIYNFMEYSFCANEFTPGQILRMNNIYRIVRDTSGGCLEGQTYIDFTLRFDDEPELLAVYLLDLTESPALGYPIYDQRQPSLRIDGIDYKNQLATKKICLTSTPEGNSLSPDGVWAIQITRTDGGMGFPSSTGSDSDEGFYGLSVNGQSFYSDSILPMTLFVYGDDGTSTSSCINESQQRFMLQIKFDNRPDFIRWELIQNEDKIIFDSSSTYMYGQSGYNAFYVNAFLHVDKCLSQGDYIFNIYGNAGSLVGPDSYYKLFIEGEEVATQDSNEGIDDSGKQTTTISISNSSPPPISGGFCFAASTTVQVLKKGIIPISQLCVGDYVLVTNAVGSSDKTINEYYEEVYSFAHYEPKTDASFVRIETNHSSKAILTLTSQHMVYVITDDNDSGIGNFIPSSQVEVDDILFLVSEKTFVSVTSINGNYIEKGVYAPFTHSGTIVVNGFLASTYVALGVMDKDGKVSKNRRGYMKVFGFFSVSHQWLAHKVVRLMISCFDIYSKKDNISGEDDGEPNIGLAPWLVQPLKIASWVLKQHSIFRNILLGYLVLILFLLSSFTLI